MIEDEEIEAARRRALAELREEERERGGDSLEQRYGPGSFGCHEAVHVVHVVQGVIDRELAAHPSIVLDPAWYADICKIQKALWGLYQKLGAAHVAEMERRAVH